MPTNDQRTGQYLIFELIASVSKEVIFSEILVYDEEDLASLPSTSITSNYVDSWHNNGSNYMQLNQLIG